MALFKTEEEKLKEDQEEIKKGERIILKNKRYNGKVGHIHQGLSYAGVWGVRNNGKMKFKSTKFEIHDTKLLIERNKMLIEFSNITEIFQDSDVEAIIMLNNDNGIPIRSINTSRTGRLRFKSFLNILNNLIEENKSDNNVESNASDVNTGDKIDKLIKLGEMYDKGLLSDEEFASLKQELLSGDDEEPTISPEDDVETSDNTCENCGSDISPDDAFCSECGTEIK